MGWIRRTKSVISATGQARTPPSPVREASRINPALSVYFDLARVTAASSVLLNHYAPVLFGASPQLFPGHDAVIVFFVLSGFVIAYVSDTREKTLREYALSRLSRLWSVTIPAVFFAIVLYGLVGPGYGTVPVSAPSNGLTLIWHSILATGFITEVWIPEVFAPFNAPMWSLSYEAFYYAIFAGLMFVEGRTRLVVVGALCALAGPNILLLMPCWLLGVALYRYRDRLSFSPRVATLLFVSTVAFLVLAYSVDLSFNTRLLLKYLSAGQSYHLGPSTSAPADWLLAPVVALHFAAIPSLPGLSRLLPRLKKPIAAAASYTLSIYLLHMPVLVLVYEYLGIGHNGGIGAVCALVLCVLSIIALGKLTEHRRADWRAALGKLWLRPASPPYPVR
jgi:peptidoglycan/LPS O-acetylase OafA/YrhL